MTLKRKASFTTITSPRTTAVYNNPTSPIACKLGDFITMDETPKHLHSRTRKRFKQDRPDEQSIYDKTLSWLFSAQKKLSRQEPPSTPSTPSTSDDIPIDDAPSLPDSNQSTLRRFFQPVRRSTPALSNTFPIVATNSFNTRMDALNSLSNVNSLHDSGSMGMDVDIPMEIDSGSESTVSTPAGDKRWVGGIGWI